MGFKKIARLSDKFYEDYNEDVYNQILRKKERPYSIYTIKLDNNLYAIPFKTTLTHNNGFFIQESSRRLSISPGLDFRKAVIIKNNVYIDENITNIVDSKEASYVRRNEDKIIILFKKYINSYKKFLKHPIYAYKIAGNYINTSLQYFWKELGIVSSSELELNLKYASCLFYINLFLEKDGYFIILYPKLENDILKVEDKNGNLLFVLTENTINEFCFKEDNNMKMKKGIKYIDVVNSIKNI